MNLGRILRDGKPVAVRVQGDSVEPLALADAGLGCLDELLSHADLPKLAKSLPTAGPALSVTNCHWLPPIDRQEVWAAGVTYKRSQTARMEESEAAADCYWRVYNSPRPELFFKATPGRCTGQNGNLRIRYDATWNVPEPELTLVISSQLKIVGYTIGNDMSSRDIEGENPLYLPQAKVYRECCGLGPWITLADAMPARADIMIQLRIERQGAAVFAGETSLTQMARELEDLVQWLGRENEFPHGAFLLTGTGIVPGNDFTLAAGDRVAITISGIGTLSSTIVSG